MPFARMRYFLWKESIFIPLAAVQVFHMLLVPPIDLPLNDDWMYAKMVSTLVHEHRYEHYPLVQPISVAHVAIGACVEAVFGESYFALHTEVLVVGLIGVWAAAHCALACGLSRRCALLTGVAVGANPLYVNLSNTFMSDIPFTTFMSLSALFFIKALRSDKPGHVLLGNVFCVAAFFVRQFGVIPAVSYAIAAAAVFLMQRRKPGPKALAAFILPWIAAAVGYTLWRNSLHSVAKLPPGYKLDEGTRIIALLTYLLIIATLMGTYLLPVSAARLYNLISRRERWNWARWSTFVYCLMLSGAVYAFYLHTGMPQPGNILHTEGIGPHTIGGQLELSEAGRRTNALMWTILTALGVCSASLLIAGAAARVSGSRCAYPIRPENQVFVAAWAILVLVSSNTAFTNYPLDRYTMPMIVPLTVLACGTLVRRASRHAVVIGGIAALVLYGCSIAGLQDYQAWNRARWDAIDYLVRDLNISHDAIDGGFEFCGMFRPPDWWTTKYTIKLPSGATIEFGNPQQAPYSVTFSRAPGFEVMKEFRYFSWLGMTQRPVYALKRVQR